MDIKTYLAIWRRRWLLVVGATLLGLGAAVAVSALTQPQYVASARLFVTTTGGASVVEAYQGNLFGQQRVLSYAQLAGGRQVAQRTIDAMKLDMTADELVPKIKAERVPQETVLLDVSVMDPNPDLARDLANTVAQQTTQLVEELETSARGGTPAATATLVDTAQTPTYPAVPNWYRNILVGVVGGLVVGLVGAIARDKLDSSVRSPAEAAGAADARLVGAVPPQPKGPKGSGIPFGASNPEATEAFRAVRTNAIAANKGEPPDVVVVAEPTGSHDAGDVTLGLAAAFAESGRSVLAVDGNLRDRAMSRRFGRESAPGLSNLIEGSSYLEEAIAGTDIGLLKVLGAGTSQAAPGELLALPAATELIKHLRTDFDIVVVCGSPVLPYSDTVEIAASSDGVLLVARSGATATPDIASAADKIRMAGGKLLGVVVSNQKHPSYVTA